jgi:chemosensory pili system protein ChpA (sensor histidine kinase/response regulator)
VRRSADLANSFPDLTLEEVRAGQLGGPGKELFEAVGDALRTDLQLVKDQLDLYMRGARSDFPRLQELVAPVRRIADTLGMVGRGELRSRLMPHCEALSAHVDEQREPDESALMSLAGDLLFVESALSALAEAPPVDASGHTEGGQTASLQTMSSGEYREHMRAAVDQAFVELAKTKDALLQYLGKPEEPTVLEPVPDRLHTVAGVLTILDQQQASGLMENLRGYVIDLAACRRELPDAEQREALADLVSGVEYYMESVVERKPDHQHALDVATAASQLLGLGEQVSPVAVESVESAKEQPGAQQSGVEQPEAEEPQAEWPEAEEFEAEEPQAERPEAKEPKAEEPAVAAVEGASEPVAETPGPSPLDDIDSEILEIFIEESREELEAIRHHYPLWRENSEDQEHLTRVRRAFHTLKGSGRLVGAMEIGEFAWSVENLLNRVLDGTVPASHDIHELLDEVVATLPALIDENAQGSSQATSVDKLQERAFQLASPSAPVIAEEAETTEPEGEPDVQTEAGLEQEPPESADIAAQEDTPEQGLDITTQELEAPVETLEEMETLGEEPVDFEGEAAASDTESELSLDETLNLEEVDLAGVTLEEPEAASAELDEIASLALDQDSEELDISSDELILENLDEPLEELADGGLSAESALEGFDLGEELTVEGLTDEPVADSLHAEAEELEDEIESILTPASEDEAPIALDSGLHDIFLNEATLHLESLNQFVENCRGLAKGCVISEELKRALHTLRGSSHMADVESMAALAGAMENWANMLSSLERRTDAADVDLLERGHFVLGALLKAINQPGANLPAWQPLKREFDQQVESLEQELAETVEVEEAPAYDPELVGIFLEEAQEIAEGLEKDWDEWKSRPDDLLPVAQLQRHLHTIKGGARLSGVMPIGDLSHAMESLFESIVERRIVADRQHQTLVRHALDELANQVDALQKNAPLVDPVAMVERLEAAARGQEWKPVEVSPEAVAEPVVEMHPPSESASEEVSSEDSFDMTSDSLDAGMEERSTDVPSEESSVDSSSMFNESHLLTDSELLGESSHKSAASLLTLEDGDGAVGTVLHEDSRIIQFPARGRHAEAEEQQEIRRPPPPEEEAKPSSASHERIRVRADLLDQMVNNAGEVSIYRARLEQQNKTFGYNLDELGGTIERLRAQLRNLEIETEAQILSRYEREHEGEAPAGFDPLEMDRYSTIQQLSRALSETVNDLASIGVSLGELNRDSDTLLVQQERVTNDLQDGLLRTRMVPFASRTARLQRVVRQTAHSLGKQAELRVIGGEGEMDRAILERMMAPLEHLLRNAVAHGIEMPEQRREAGKPEVGTVSLIMSREGADVVLTVSDDGRGLDRDAIRAKAIERGLIEEGAELDDNDLEQMILGAGFSTASEVSQISGRGVGMDVVISEVKQLGGSLDLDSQSGSGSSFNIRLPFTLAITESLLVTSGDDVYAVPHSAMDGVVRISRADLEACYRGERETFSYGGRDYNVRYLGSMLGNTAPFLPEGERWFPLLLVRSGEHRVAVHVDSLLGNRQIVVKSVGLQLSSVRWFTGGTILADGRIALILDVNSLIRQDTLQPAPVLGEYEPEAAQSVKVMVVDDSITVRKVTTRLLERHNMQVITAKDGVDAVTILQEELPDVMLLDIEMPRMDGFELARHMRSMEGLRDIPIIMITSRTGEKHRNLATELGVKRYLGKPYQEADLLENIYTVLAEVEHE